MARRSLFVYSAYMKLKDITLYEDSDILVINKPAGLMVHGDGRTKEKTLADFLIEEYPEMKEIGEPWVSAPVVPATDSLQTTNYKLPATIYRPGIVHRLDRETSGVLVIAKNQEAFLSLKDQFKNRTTEKHYRAFVWGFLAESEGIIDKPIGRSPSDFRRFLSGHGARGELRDAVTEYKVLKQFVDASGEKFSFLDISPKTGRTHQIRVHMKYLQRPIACDKLYAPKNPCALGFDRVALHAYSLSINLPKTKERMTFVAPLPVDFINAGAVA